MPKLVVRLVLAGALVAGAGCRGAQAESERRSVEAEMKGWIALRLDAWEAASRDLAARAPLAPDRGWDRTADAVAIREMKQAWHRARDAYELVEGAVAPTFPESDAATDARYDDFLLALGGAGDSDPFDDEGVVGMHALERILWADSAPAEVVSFEKGLPGYGPARFPSTREEAERFKHRLATRLVSDVQRLKTDFQPLTLDVAFAFRGLVDLAVEQAEKVDRAATGQEESRYAESTMRDLRANHQGCLEAYRFFRPWLLSRPGGAERDAEVRAAFDRLKLAYAAVPGDAIPRPPSGWSSLAPLPGHLDTPFGRLFTLVRRETDEQIPGSLSASLVAVARALEMPEIVVR